MSEIGTIEHTINKHKDLLKELENGRNYILDAALAIEEEQKDEEQQKELEECIVTYLRMDDDIRDHITVLTEIIAITTEEQNLAQYLTRRVQQLKENSRRGYENHPEYKNFKKRLWEVHHEGQSQPDSFDDTQDIVSISQQKQTYRCPLTMATFEKPYKNQVCGHTYSQNAILELVRTANRKQTKCPVAGCSAQVTEDSLERNVEMEHQLKRKRKKVDSRSEDIIVL